MVQWGDGSCCLTSCCAKQQGIRGCTVEHGNERRYGARDQSTSQEDYLGHYISLLIGLNGTFAGWDTLLVCLLFLGAF